MTTTVDRAAVVARPRGSRVAVSAADASVAAVLLAYAVSALVIPTLANVAVTDDWVYYRSVETLLLEHRLQVHDMSSAALVFQLLWGAAFAAVFGLSFGVLRVSTLVLVGLSGLAFYRLARALDIPCGWSAVGLAAYLFHPLGLSLAYTFMTDPHYVALLVIASWLYVRGLREGRTRPAWVLAASAGTACATLVRQQGVLVPGGVLLALLLGGRLAPLARGVRLVLLVAGLPAVAAVGFMTWLRFGPGTPWALDLFWRELGQAGVNGVVGLLPRLGVIEAIYFGFFVLPIALAAVAAVRPTRLGGWVLAAGLIWTAVVSLGALSYWFDGQKTMPYVGQFVSPTGIGPEDLIAARPILLDQTQRVGLTVGCALASILVGWIVLARLSETHEFFGSSAGIVTGIALSQLAGTVPPSVHFIGWGGTLDRYLLPLLPFALLALLWTVGRARLLLPLAWLPVLAMAAWSVAGTRDHLAWLNGVWSIAQEANALGIPDTRLDAGAGWDGFHLYVSPPGRPSRSLDPPWWADLFAPSTDSSYIVAGEHLPGYPVVLERSYWSWLHQRALPLYLLRRPGIDGPP